MADVSLLPAIWEVPQIFRDRLGRAVGRQRAMIADGHLLLVLHAPPKPEDDDREGRFFWRNPQGEWRASTGGNGLPALERHLEDFLSPIEACDRLEEAAAQSVDYFKVLQELAPLLRTARNLHEVLQDGRTALPEERALINLRDRAYAIVRRVELLTSHAKMSLDFEIARNAEEQARASDQMAVSAHRLNVLAAFFFPLATISGVFGMDLDHGIEERIGQPWTFLLVIGSALLSGFVLKWFITRSGRNTGGSNSTS